MEIKIKFDLLNEALNQAVTIKKEFDSFKKELDSTSCKIKQVLEDINSLIIIFIIGDGFI
jgi:hypothetical protein